MFYTFEASLILSNPFNRSIIRPVTSGFEIPLLAAYPLVANTDVTGANFEALMEELARAGRAVHGVCRARVRNAHRALLTAGRYMMELTRRMMLVRVRAIVVQYTSTSAEDVYGTK